MRFVAIIAALALSGISDFAGGTRSLEAVVRGSADSTSTPS